MKILWLVMLLLSGPAFAQEAESFANCATASEQVKFYQGRVQPAARIAGMNGLLDDLKRVHAELKRGNSPHPKALLEPCLEKKKQAFEYNIKYASAQLADEIAFNLAAGEYTLLVGEYTAAYNFYSKVALRDPNNFDAHQWRYLAWSHMTRENLVAHKPEKYYEDLKYHLEAILNHPRCPRSTQEEAHIQLADAAVLMQKNEIATTHWEKALSLNPQNIEVFLKLSEQYQKGSNSAQALRLYELYVPQFQKPDDRTQVAYERWASLLEQEKRFSSAQSVLQAALQRFPKNEKFKSHLARLLVENKKFQEAQALLAQSSPADQKADQNKSIALARLEEQKGDQAQASGQPGMALGHYNKALEHDPNRQEVRFKAARLLFNHHKTLGFASGVALNADMDAAVSFLAPLYARGQLSSEEFGLMIQIAERSSTPERAVGACRRFKAAFGRINPNSVDESCRNAQQLVDKRALATDVATAKKEIYNSTGTQAEAKEKAPSRPTPSPTKLPEDGARAPASSLRRK